MFDFLKNHALANVWCTPNQDNQLILKMPRITQFNGVMNRISVLYETLTLPVLRQRFHVYQIGGVPLRFINLFGKRDEWSTLASSCDEGKNIIDCYHTSGIQYPRTQVWSCLTENGNVLIAIPRQPKINIDFNSTDIFLRVYSNAYFESDRSLELNNYIEVKGKTLASTDDIIELQTFYAQKSALSNGKVSAFVNGYKVPAFNMLYAGVGDVAEVVYDSSIYKEVIFPVTELLTFDSTLDNKGKYILHYPGNDSGSIDFYDDIDLYLINTVTNKGVYMHHNAVDSIRMLTHRDYAIAVPYVTAYAQELKGAGGAVRLQDMSVVMHVRKSGYFRPLIHEHHRIKELYQLKEEDLKAALTGIDANVTVWDAASLEESAYPLVMRSKERAITRQMVQDAYGYHGVATIVADTPIKRDMGRSLLDIPVPYLLAYDATVSEYTDNGLLIGNYRHTNGFSYQPRNESCRYAEMLCGNGSQAIDDNFNQVVPYNSLLNYRYYVGEIPVGSNKAVWTDVTGSGLYAVSTTSNTITWSSDAGDLHCVRSDARFLQYSKQVGLQDGLILFQLEQQRIVSGVARMVPMEIPMGELDVFLNKHPLIEGLDYMVQFPTIVICNREYLEDAQNSVQSIVVRHTGFCDSDFKRTKLNEFGFVQHGKLSRNGRYNLHDARVQRIQCGGRIYVRGELPFNETALTYDFTSADNGKPYLIRDVVVPMRGLVDENTYSFRKKSLDVDEEISEYLTLKLPESSEPEPNPIDRPYSLFSPFICKILYDVIRDVIDIRQIEVHYDDTKLRQIVAPYIYLLDYDPINIERSKIDPQYVVVQPHFLQTVVDVNLSRYRFMKRVVEMYGNGRINLSSLLRLVE